MSSYSLKCRKNTEIINPRVWTTNNGKRTILSKGAIFGSKEIKIYYKTRSNGKLNNLGLEKSLKKIPLLGDILFWTHFHWMQLQVWMRHSINFF